MMRALSIRQPYAWLIIRPDITDPEERCRAYGEGRIKDIENRGWPTKVRGHVLIHAGKSYTRAQHTEYMEIMREEHDILMPRFEDLLLGGIVGAVNIIDCVSEHPSRWKDDAPWGFVLANAGPLPFRPLRGMLGFFGVRAA